MKFSPLFFLLLPIFLFSQSDPLQKSIDSLYTIVEADEHDTLVVQAWQEWVRIIKKSNPEKAHDLNAKIQAFSMDILSTKKNAISERESTLFYKAATDALNKQGAYNGYRGFFDEADVFFNQAHDLAKEFKDDEMIAKQLNNIAIGHYIRGDFNTAIDFFKQSLEIKKRFKDRGELARSYNNLGLVYKDIGEVDKALEYYNLSLQEFKAVGDEVGAANPLNNLAIAYNQKGDYDTTLKYYFECLRIGEEADDAPVLVSALINLGYTYVQFGNFSEAINYYDRALKKADAIGDRTSQAKCLSHIGEIYFQQKEYEKSKENFIKSLALREKIGNKSELVNSLISFGAVSGEMGNDEESEVYFNRAMEISAEIEAPQFMALALTNLAVIQKKKSQYTKALETYFSALKIFKELDNQEGEVQALNGIAKTYDEMGRSQKAIQYGAEAMKVAKSGSFINDLEDAAQLLYVNHKKAGNSRKSLEMYELYVSTRDSINSEANQKEVIHQEYRYSYDKKALADSIQYAQAEQINAAELAAEKATSKQQKQRSNFLLGGLGLTLLLGGIIFNRFRVTRKQKIIIEGQKKEVDKAYGELEEEQEKVKSQNVQLQELNTTKDKFFGIIAHDIRSPIIALDGVGNLMEHYIKKNDSQKLERLAGRVDSTAKGLSRLLDNLLNWALLQQGVVPYHPKYLEVDKVGKEVLQMFQSNAAAKGIVLESTIGEDLSVFADESSLQTILRNLIGNAIKFTSEGGKVSIVTEEKNQMIYLHIRDNGAGIAREKLDNLFSLEVESEKGTAGEKGTGLGLTLVKELTELNKGSISVSSEINVGSKFTVGLPKKEV